MDIIKKLKNKYKIINYDKLDDENSVTVQLFMRWGYRIEKNWYGFDLGPVPFVWFHIINEFLEYIETQDPGFKILQQKVKYGQYRCYLQFSENLDQKLQDKINEEIHELENWLFSKKLIY